MKGKVITRYGVVFTVLAAACLCAVCCFAQPAKAHAVQGDLAAGSLAASESSVLATQATASYTLGKAKAGSVTTNADKYFTFKIGKTGADVSISFKNTGGDGVKYSNIVGSRGLAIYADLLDSSGDVKWYSGSIYSNESTSDTRVYLAPGTYRMKIYTYAYQALNYQTYTYDSYAHTEKFSFTIAKQSQKAMLSKRSGKYKVGSAKDLTIKLSGTDYYSKKNLKVAKNTNKKVATAKLTDIGGKEATLTITPKKMGKTVVKVNLAGGNTLTHTVYVTSSTVYMAKGTKVKLAKPLGVKSPKFANKTKKSKKIAKTTKAGKVTAKKQGRSVIVVKKGKIKYSYKVVVTDYKKLGRETFKLIKEYVPNPDELKINYSYKGYYKISGTKVPVVYIDYSYGNESGGKSRNKIVAWYDDANDAQMTSVMTSSNVIEKKWLKIK